MPNLIQALASKGITYTREKYPFINPEAPFREVYTGRLTPGEDGERAVEDGDTFVAFKDGVAGDYVTIRVLGIDTAEVSKLDTIREYKAGPEWSEGDPEPYYASVPPVYIQPPKASEGTYALMDLIEPGATESYDVEGSEVTIVDIETDKYGRTVALVFNAAGECINWEMLQTGLAPSFFTLPLIINRAVWDAMDNSRNKSEAEKADLLEEFQRLFKYNDDVVVSSLDDGRGSEIKGAMKIGLTWLPVGAKSINVTQQELNQEFSNLRTPGDPIIKNPRLNKRIEVTAIFPSIQDMNEKLRVLTAQFLRSPFLPIENDHLYGIIFSEILPSEYIERHRVDSLTNAKADAIFDIDESKDVPFGPVLKASIKEFELEYTQKNKEIVKLRADIIKLRGELEILEDGTVKDEKQAELNDKESLLKLKYEELKNFNKESHYQKIVDMFIANPDAFRDKYEMNSKGLFDDIKLVCSLQEINVSTVPGFTQVAQCVLVLDVFNYSAYSPIFRYCKDHVSTLRQAEYFNNRSKSIDQDKRKYSNYNLRTPFVNHTDNISEAAPFIDYIKPLLTGQPFNVKLDAGVDMIIDSTAVSDTETDKKLKKSSERNDNPKTEMEQFISRTNDKAVEDERSSSVDSINVPGEYTFWAPDNWLRPVENEEDFKNFQWEMEMTDLTTEEKLVLQKAKMMEDTRIEKLLERVSSGLVKSPIAIKDYESAMQQVSYLYDKLIEGIMQGVGLFTGNKDVYTDIIKIIKSGWVKDNKDITIPLPFTVEDKRSGAKLSVKKAYTAEQIIDFFKNLRSDDAEDGTIVTGEDVLELIKQSEYLKERLQVGTTINYKLNFKEKSDLVVSGLSATMTTKMADLPVSIHTVPTKQFMGRSNWHVNLNIQTCNYNFIKILSTFSRRAALSRLNRKRSRMDWFIYQGNALHIPPDPNVNGFFKLLGINNVLFEGFEYSTIDKKPGWWNISIRFVQADMNLSDFERLLPWKQYYDPKVLDKIISKFMTKYKDVSKNIFLSDSESRDAIKKTTVTYDSAENNLASVKFDKHHSAVVQHVIIKMREMMMRLLTTAGYGEESFVPDIWMDGATGAKRFRDTIKGFSDIEKMIIPARYRSPGIGHPEFSEDLVIGDIYNIWGISKKMEHGFKAHAFKLYLEPYFKNIDKMFGIINYPIKTVSNLSKKMLEASKRLGSGQPSLEPVVDGFANIIGVIGDIAWSIVEFFPALIPTLSTKLYIDRINRLNRNYVSLSHFQGDIPIPSDLLENIAYQYIKQLIVKSLIVDKHGVLDFINDGKKEDIKIDEKRLVNTFDPSFANDIDTARLYGSYPDLELPLTTGELVLPSDFYYIKPEFFYSDDSIHEDMKNTLKYLYNESRLQAELIYNLEAIHLLNSIDTDSDRFIDEEIFDITLEWVEKFNIFDVKLTEDMRKEIKNIPQSDIVSKRIQMLFEKYDLGDIENTIYLRKDYAKRLIKLKEFLEEKFGKDGLAVLPRIKKSYEASPEMLLDILRYGRVVQKTDTGRKNILLIGNALRMYALTDIIGPKSSKNERRFVTEKERTFAKLLFENEQIANSDSDDLRDWGVTTPYNIAKTSQIYTKAKLQMDEFKSRDSTAHLGRAFPTAKVFFIEEDGKEWGL